MAAEDSIPAAPAAMPRELPKHLHFKDGRYYYVKRGGPKKTPVWTGLSRNYSEALQQYVLLQAGKPKEAFETEGAPAYWLGQIGKTVFDQTQRRAREADILFTLTVDDIIEFGMSTNWCCAVTGIRFKREKLGDATRRPFMPSVDRINTKAGYTKSNCRLVCWAANLAMSNWGEGVLAEMAIAYVRHHQLQGRG